MAVTCSEGGSYPQKHLKAHNKLQCYGYVWSALNNKL